MFKFIHNKENQTIEYHGRIENFGDRIIDRTVLDTIVQEIADRYVRENYDSIIKLIDMDAFKQNLTIALTVAAMKKVNGSL